MIELALRTTALLAVGFVATRLLWRATPSTRHLVWHITLLLVVAAPVLQFWVPHIQLPAAITSVTRDWPRRAASLTSTNASDSFVGIPVAAGRVTDTCAVEPAAACEVADIAACPSPSIIWMVGSLVTGGWFALGWLISSLLARRASPAPNHLVLEMRTVAKQLRVTRMPGLRMTTEARGPSTVGAFQPLILLPTTAIDWDADRRWSVLAHELAHVRRGDVRTHALAQVTCALYWFNPLAWMAARATKRERERACDDAVIALGVRPSRYAQDLLEIASESGMTWAPSAALAMARPSELEGRLVSLLSSNRRRTPTRGARWIVSAAMVACATLALGGRIGATVSNAAPPLPPIDDAVPSVYYDGERHAAAQTRRDNDRTADALAHSTDDDARERAALSLTLSGDPSAIDSLIRALGDSSAPVRERPPWGSRCTPPPRSSCRSFGLCATPTHKCERRPRQA